MKFRLQISSDDKYGADYGNRNEPDCEDFLNEETSYQNLEVQKCIDDLMKKMEDSEYRSNYRSKINILKSRENYKVLVVGVGTYGSGEICLYRDGKEENSAKEIAHIDLVEEDGSWMNRLYVFDKEPKKITFYNKKIKKNKTITPEFKEQCFVFYCDF